MSTETENLEIQESDGVTDSNADAPKAPTHLLLYTDGGCKPSRGIGGWGIHGYTYALAPAKTGIGHPKVTATAEGYVEAKGKSPITLFEYWDGYGSLIPEATNNSAELTAALEACKVAEQTQLPTLTLVMDSQYVLDGMQRHTHAWAAQDWIKKDGTPVINAELWKDLHEIRLRLESAGTEIHYRKVKGHSGDVGNDTVDAYANRAIAIGRNNVEVHNVFNTPAKGYWNRKSSRNRMIANTYWIFNQALGRDRSNDGRAIIHLSDIRDDIEYFGKPISDATFAVVFLKEPEPVLEELRQFMFERTPRNNMPVFAARVKEIFKPESYDEIAQFKRNVVKYRADHGRIFSSADKLLVEELSPPGLAYRGMETMNVLEQRLENYLTPNPNSRTRFTDITSIFYKDETKKTKTEQKLNPKITPNTTNVVVPGKYLVFGGTEEKVEDITLVVGQDTPDRNTIAALAGEAKMTLVTWTDSARALRYATILEADGDIGIWCGVYSNLHIIL